MLYLKIENPGVAPVEAFTLMGASTKRNSTNSQLIGKFGTGNKQAIATLLRANLSPVIYCGNLKLSFSTRTQQVRSTIDCHEFQRIVVSYQGKDESGASRSGSEELGFVLEHGAVDWQSPDLALREFISNALDRAAEQGLYEHLQEYKKQHADCDEYDLMKERDRYQETATDFQNVKVELVSESMQGLSRVRARAGYTRIYVPVNEEIFRFYNNLGKWFLHFSEPQSLKMTILPKKDRNIGACRTAVVYRRGVRVREVESNTMPSLFDYNLEELQLDEARKVDDWRVQYEATRAFDYATEDEMVHFWAACIEQRQVWEMSFNGSYMYSQSDAWRKAFVRAAGQDAVLATADSGDFAARKGYKIIRVPENILNAAAGKRIPTATSVLSQDEQAGRVIMDPDQGAIDAVDWAWDLVTRKGLTRGKQRPDVKIFSQSMSGEAQTLGLYRDNLVLINRDITGAGNTSIQLKVTALEEVVHHVTGAKDNSRDFQDYLLNLVVHCAE